MKPPNTKTLTPREQLEEFLQKEVKSVDGQIDVYTRYVTEYRQTARRLRVICAEANVEVPSEPKGDSDLELMEELREAQLEVAGTKNTLEMLKRELTESQTLVGELRREKQQLRLELTELREASTRDTLKRIALRWLRP